MDFCELSIKLDFSATDRNTQLALSDRWWRSVAKSHHYPFSFEAAYADGSTLYSSLKHLAKYFGLLIPTR